MEDLAPRIQELRQRQKQLEASRFEVETALSDRRVELADLGLVSEYVADLRNVLTYSSLAEQRSFIRSFVKEVKVTGTDCPVDLYYAATATRDNRGVGRSS